jgi:hypothetical protein
MVFKQKPHNDEGLRCFQFQGQRQRAVRGRDERRVCRSGQTRVQSLQKTGDRRDVSGFLRLWYFLLVARFTRVIALDTPHHVTQRGKAWQFILATDAERLVYLELLRHTHTGRPLGTPEFIQRLERDSGRALVAQKGGRPRKAASDSRQSTLNF